jgi:hypothetical protein
MHSRFVVVVGLVAVQSISAALVMHDRVDDILTAIRSVFS